RRADQYDRPVLDVGQKRVLLGLVPAVNFVDEQGGALAIQLAPLAGHVNRLANLLDPGQDGVDGDEVAARAVGDDHSQRRLARARRAIEDERRKLVGLNGAAQQAAGTDDVALAGELVERARPHAGGQRRFLADALLRGVGEQVGHAVSLSVNARSRLISTISSLYQGGIISSLLMRSSSTDWGVSANSRLMGRLY